MTATDDESLARLSASVEGRVDGRFDAFISYRRLSRDEAFVDRLQQALKAHGKTVWVDRAMIEPASDWLQRITRGIDAARAFLFVITPESASSPECRREFELAVQRNKLVVPVMLRPADPHAPPDRLAQPTSTDLGPRWGEPRA